MDTRPLRIFLLGTTLAVGAVVGLAPASEAKPIQVEIIDPPIVVAPPTTVRPPIDVDPCLIVDCDGETPEVDDEDCIRVPRLCDPPTDTPPEDEPPLREPPTKRPRPEPIPPRHSDNPDVVTQTPRFTG